MSVTTSWAAVVTGLAVVGFVLRRFLPKRRISLKGKTVVITGCDTGFGAGVVAALVDEGASVISLCYTSQGVDRTINSGVKSSLLVDLSDEKQLSGAASEIIKLLKGEDLFAVVHNAGTVTAGMIDFMPMENYRRVMEVNFFAVVALNAHLLPLLKERTNDGSKKRVIIVSSVDGLVSLPGNAPYDASKFAVEAYADALRIEQSFWDIKVSVINPSTMKTPLALGFFETEKQTYERALTMDKNPSARWKKEWPKSWLDAHIETNSKGLEQIAQDPKIVIKDMVDSLTSAEPEFRYLSGTAAKTLFWFLWVAPEWLSFSIKKATIAPPPSVITTDSKIKE
jgi:NAD(P)-dependent dehydrogenase (short-subunit alcohol dehydrogenase family)